MKNMKISAKLFTGFGSIAAFVIILGIISLTSLSTVSRAVTSYAAKTLPSIQAIWQIKYQMVTIEKYLIEAIASYNQEDTLSIIDKMSEEQRKLDEFIRDYKGNDLTSPELMEEFETQYREMSRQHQKIVSQLQFSESKTLRENALNTFDTQYVPAYERSIQALLKIAQEAQSAADEQSLSAEKTIVMGRAAVFFAILVSILLAGTMGAFIRKTIISPVREIEQAARQLSEGHLSNTITYQSRDEFGSLAASLQTAILTIQLYIRDIERAMGEMSHGNFDVKPAQPFIGDFKQIESAISSMILQMSSILNQINTSARLVTEEAYQVSSNAQQMAQGASEQASSVEELSSSIEEVSQRVKHNAENARHASLMAIE